MDDEQYAAYTFVPSDPELALALDSAAKMAREADEKFCAAFGGDGETSAFWLTAAVSEIRAALSRQALRAPAPSEAVVERGARALFADSHPGESWDQTTDVYRDYHRSTARLILTAILTPDAP